MSMGPIIRNAEGETCQTIWIMPSKAAKKLAKNLRKHRKEYGCGVDKPAPPVLKGVGG